MTYYTRSTWKNMAKRALKGNYAIAIFGMAATWGVGLFGSILANYFFPGSSISAVLLAQAFQFIFSLIICIFSAGYSYMMMNFARGRQASMGDLLYFFTRQPDRVIIAGFVMTVIQLVTQIPLMYFTFTSHIGTTADEQLAWSTHVLLLTIVGLLAATLLTMPLSMAYYLLADHEELGGMEALKESAYMMKGHLGQYFLLQLSFVPIMIGSVIALYIPLLWIMPYIEMTNIEFYRDLSGEFAPQPDSFQ